MTWYSRAHAFLHSAKDFREPFGLAPVEAQACGLPVVCFDNGALRETVIQDRTGAICKTEEEFLQAIDSPWIDNFDETDRVKCRKNALRFTVENMINRVEELCKEAVEAPW